MVGTQGPRGGLLRGLVVAAVAAWAATAHALYLDENQDITLRARIYSQATIRAEDSSVGTTPVTKTGQLVQHRNFFNPELDAKLTPYSNWLKGTVLEWLAPDDLNFRLAAWGFYDGIYDYGTGQFDAVRRAPSADADGNPTRAWILAGDSIAGSVRNPADATAPFIGGATLDEVFPGHDIQNPHDIYATQRRINELYLSYTKGPLFIRIGKQGISWGESDTVALLDQNNPYDVTLGAPGIFEDLEEARIPLWTLRTSLALPSAGAFSNNSIEVYWVPGDIDVNTGIVPIQTVSPYSPRGLDPQYNLPELTRGSYQIVVFDHQPKSGFENSRWGVRTQSVLNRFFTLSAWYYTHFPNAPVPRKVGITQPDVWDRPLVVSEIVHKLTGVAGVSNTFFFEPFDGIVRMEAEYFNREPAFIPEANLGSLDLTNIRTLAKVGHVPRADFLRWELGFDRFFFWHMMNPSSSFTFVSSLVGSWNLDETSRQDFRAGGQMKPSYLAKQASVLGPTTDDFVQLKKVEGFVQTTLQTDYLHGRLTPRLTNIVHSRGTYLVRPNIDYRIRDWLLLNVAYVTIGGDYQSFGFFRDRDQLSVRMTYQLN